MENDKWTVQDEESALFALQLMTCDSSGIIPDADIIHKDLIFTLGCLECLFALGWATSNRRNELTEEGQADFLQLLRTKFEPTDGEIYHSFVELQAESGNATDALANYKNTAAAVDAIKAIYPHLQQIVESGITLRSWMKPLAIINSHEAAIKSLMLKADTAIEAGRLEESKQLVIEMNSHREALEKGISAAYGTFFAGMNAHISVLQQDRSDSDINPCGNSKVTQRQAGYPSVDLSLVG